MSINEISSKTPITPTFEETLTPSTMTQHNAAKRAFDLFFSVAFLVLGAPFYLPIALAIKFTSKGPIFYSGVRVGRGGKKIRCLKFRSMHQNAEAKLQQLLEENPVLKEEWEIYFKLKNDPRITSIGKFLRKTSLDELPQFLNVLKGDLSIVGPRPVTPEEVKKYFGDKTEKLLSVRPGITGLWQTSGRSSLPWNERLLLEESYIDKRSFLFDIVLIIKTAREIFLSKGAY